MHLVASIHPSVYLFPVRESYVTLWGISHWLSSGLGSDSEPSPSRATSVNTIQLGSEITSLHSKSEPDTGGSGQAQLRLSSEISEPSPEPSQCEMPLCVCNQGAFADNFANVVDWLLIEVLHRAVDKTFFFYFGFYQKIIDFFLFSCICSSFSSKS